MTYLTYYIRTTEDKWQDVIEFGKLLGVITETEEHGITHVGAGCWNYIGAIYEQVGVDEDDLPIMEPLKEGGKPLLHANLRTTVNLRERALEIPELTNAMTSLGDYFLLDEAGNARAPSQPYCVFSGG